MRAATRPSTVRQLTANLIALLLSIAVLWGIGEVVVRLATPPPDAGDLTEPLPNSPRVYRLRPGSVARRSGISVRINSGGFRDREYPRTKPPGVFRILLLGDSFTMGLGVPAESTYAKRLERSLAAPPVRALVSAAGRDSVETLNFGVGGYNTLQERLFLEEIGFGYAPDLVVVGVNLNDVYDERGRVVRTEGGVVEHRDLGASDGGSPIRRFRRTITATSRFASFLDYRLDQLRRRLREDSGADTRFNELFRTDNPGYASLTRELAAIRDACAAHGAGFLAALLPNMTNLDAEYPYRAAHAALAASADSAGLPFVDLLAGFLGRKPETLWVSWENPHPNAAGQAILAEGLLACLKERRLGPFSGPSAPTPSDFLPPATPDRPATTGRSP